MTYPGYPALAGGSHFSVTEGLCESTAAVSFLTGSGVKAEKKYTKKFVLYSHEIITNFTTTVYLYVLYFVSGPSPTLFKTEKNGTVK